MAKPDNPSRIPVVDLRAMHMHFGDKIFGRFNPHSFENRLEIVFQVERLQDDPHRKCDPSRQICYAKKENCR